MPFYSPLYYYATDFRLNFTGNQVKIIIEYKNYHFLVVFAGMAKLVDALDLGSSGATHRSSSLLTRTKINPPISGEFLFAKFSTAGKSNRNRAPLGCTLATPRRPIVQFRRATTSRPTKPVRRIKEHHIQYKCAFRIIFL